MVWLCIFIFSIHNRISSCCCNHRKYNSHSEKIITLIWLLSGKHAKSEGSCQNISDFKTTSLVKEIHKIGYIQYIECCIVHAIWEIVQKKKKASAFYTWLPLNHCQPIDCALFIYFNAIYLIQYNYLFFFWSTCHIQITQ